MDNRDWDRLLERNLSGDPPGRVFRTRVVLESTTALIHRRQIAARWRVAARAAAAVLIAAVSFLAGRFSYTQAETGAAVLPAPVASENKTAAVQAELVAWMDAARFFRQLGMEDRMMRAYERAGELLPRDVTAADGGMERMWAATGDEQEPGGVVEAPDSRGSVEVVKRMMAQF